MTLKVVSHVQLEGLKERLQALGSVEYHYLDPMAEVPSDLRADALLTIILGAGNLRQILAPEHRIDWVHVFGTGIDGFDVEAVGTRELTCSRGATAVPIAEWVMAMLLAAVKQLPASWHRQPPEQWRFAPLTTLAGQTLALVGLGSIGAAVAKRALAFDMRVKALVRTPRPSPLAGVEVVTSLETLVADADHVVLAAPATAATHHLINARTLAAMNPGAHLVNVARASLVDEPALRQALDSGQLARASIDVADPEPLPAEHWFFHHPKLYFSPHISWNGPDVFEQMIQRFVDNVERRLRGEPLAYRVDPVAGY